MALKTASIPTIAPNRPGTYNFLKVDTDKAFEVAQQHGGKQLTEKDPKLQILYELDLTGTPTS